MVLLFVTECLRGGAERVTTLIASELSKQKEIDVHLCSFYHEDIEYNVSSEVTVHYMNKNYGNKYNEMLHELIFLNQIIDEIKPDAIISLATYRTNILLAFAKLRKAVLIESERNDPRNYPKNRAKQILRDWAYSRCDAIVLQTEDVKEYFSWINKSKVNVIPNPVCVTDEMIYSGKRDNRIVCCARLVPQKNIKLLLDAFYEILKINAKLTLHIYGKGYLEEELREQVAELQMQDNVFFEGIVQDATTVIKNAFCYIMTSNYEGISNAMLEAVSLGVPTIATDCPVGGAKMVLESGKFGILVPTNDKNAIVKAVKYLIDNPEYSEELHERSSVIRKKYSVEKIAEEWLQVISKYVSIYEAK